MKNGHFRRVFITGGAGFIGSNFIRFLREHRPTWEIVNFDVLTYAGNLENLRDVANDHGYAFVRGDVRDGQQVRAALDAGDCDTVVHFAAESHVDRSIDDAAPFLTTNVLGTQVVLDACLAMGDRVKRVVHIGTDEVYGSLPLDRPDLAFGEDSPLRPNSPYAASKAAGDLLALAYHRTYNLPVLVTRCSNNFGPYQFPEKVIPLFVTNLIDGRKVPLYGDGLNVRDWLHVTDHCEAILAVLERGRTGEVYNIGGNNERSNLELTHTILELMGFGGDESAHDRSVHSMIEPVPDRPGHDRRYAIDAAKIERELGWRPTRSAWPDALAQTIEWYRANEAWWRPLKKSAFNATMLRKRSQPATASVK
jgi:dTDP-glucose 4,6-dehydratase